MKILSEDYGPTLIMYVVSHSRADIHEEIKHEHYGIGEVLSELILPKKFIVYKIMCFSLVFDDGYRDKRGIVRLTCNNGSIKF